MNRNNFNNKNNIQAINTVDEITEENFADMAHNVIKKGKSSRRITNTQLRQILSIINKIIWQNNKSEKTLKVSEIGEIQYLKTRVVYAAGRDKAVKEFIIEAGILEFINRIIKTKDRQDLLLFGRYFESLIAFHKFEGGRD